MHYSAMEAVIFAPGSMPDPANQLSGDTLGVPVVIAAVMFVLVALVTVYTDIKMRLVEEDYSRQEEARAEGKAFSDDITRLPNRAGLEQFLLATVNEHRNNGQTFAVLMMEMSDLREITAKMPAADAGNKMLSLARKLQSKLSDGRYLNRYSYNRFCLVTENPGSDNAQQHIYELFFVTGLPEISGFDLHWNIGFSSYPQTAQSNRELLRQALKTQPFNQQRVSERASVA